MKYRYRWGLVGLMGFALRNEIHALLFPLYRDMLSNGLIIVLLIGWVSVMAARRRWRGLIGGLIVMGMIIWPPFPHPLTYPPRSVEGVMNTCEQWIDRLNGAPRALVEDDAYLVGASQAIDALGQFPASRTAPQWARYPSWMSSWHLAGCYLPWNGKALVNPAEPAVTRPFTACHEAVHQRGVVDEGQANIIAWQACMQGDDAFQYSGSCMALAYAMRALATLTGESSAAVQGCIDRMADWTYADYRACRNLIADNARTLYGNYDDLVDALGGIGVRVGTEPSEGER